MNFLAVAIALLSLAAVSAGISGRRALKLTCPRVVLANGRARPLNGGREVRFRCHQTYKPLGDQYAICVRGRWSAPPPVCVKRGCSPIADPFAGSWQPSMGGAVATLVCDPGYTLANSTSSDIYCDGRSWRPRKGVPSCRVITNSPKPSCDFESDDICGWVQDASVDFVWTRNNYSTPSGHQKTGPSFDHTFGEGFGGHYMFIETSSPRKEDDIARLYSPVYVKEFAEDGCFMFWYHMYGSNTGSLKIYAKPQSRPLKDLTPLFQKSGNQGPRWIQGMVSLTSINESFQVIIEATRGNGFLGDSAVDDVALKKGDDCVVLPDQPITAAIRQDVETSTAKTTREQVFKTFPTFLPAPPLPALPPRPPGTEVASTTGSQGLSSESPTLSSRLLTTTPVDFSTYNRTIIAQSTSNRTLAYPTSASSSAGTYRPFKSSTAPYTTNRSQIISSTFPATKFPTAVTTILPASTAVIATIRSNNMSSTSDRKVRYTSSTPTISKYSNTTPLTTRTAATSYHMTSIKQTSTRLPTTAITKITGRPTPPFSTRLTTASNNATTSRPTTSTSSYTTTPKQPLPIGKTTGRLVTNATKLAFLPSTTRTPTTNLPTRFKAFTIPIVFKTRPTIRYRTLPVPVTRQVPSTTSEPPRDLPSTTTRPRKPTSRTFQRVVKPVRPSNRIQASTTSSGQSTKTVVVIVAVTLTVLLCAVLAYFVVRKRLRMRSQKNVAEDSDVRYLTSDEILDFNLARPADDEA